ncbi:unnamed protein product [Didymodactylos carnosus]|uniref:Uncharacterized protein n=1 Tax=Didymodactylos carnosus TaxID=1234261 RepID=A0A814WR12_9BILA|nr:unnamed protein product [Didymodactylos carnosus]CAF3973116.1 unnamed protein product [Didymodactylos carnosus]
MSGRTSSHDEDLLLQDFSRNVTTKSWALFFGNAAIVSAIPLSVSTFFLNKAYSNMKFILKHKIAQKREDAIGREINRLFAIDKNASKKEKDDRNFAPTMYPFVFENDEKD